MTGGHGVTGTGAEWRAAAWWEAGDGGDGDDGRS